ncbi:MAG: N4-gp56 family major capsid protein [Dehalococcoidales bacterium]|nr:N4-gp56 family major capsid protein [Dehalococcoidales bacterium]
MASVITGATSDVGSGQLSNLVITAYETVSRFALRSDLCWDQMARTKPGNLTNPGNPISFRFWDDMAVVTTPLSEAVDVDSVGLSDTTTTITPYEYGSAVVETRRLSVDSFQPAWDADVANILARNMVESIDEIARLNSVDTSTNITYTAGSTESTLTTGNVITPTLIRQERVKLTRANVVPWEGDKYLCIIAPEVAYDFKVNTGEAGWLFPNAYTNTIAAANFEIGSWGGFRFLETNRTYRSVGGGAAADDDVYKTYFLGQEGIAKVESIAPHVVQGPITDKLARFIPLGWHTYLGYGLLRTDAVRVITSSSSMT